MELRKYETFDEFIAEYSGKGWQIISRTDNAIQMRLPKQWNRLGLILGLLGLFLYGAGLVILILTVIDYLFQKELVGYATLDQLQSGLLPEIFSQYPGSWIMSVFWIILILVGVILFVAFLAAR